MAVNARSVRVRARARVHCTCKGVAALTCMPDAELSALEMPVEPRGWRRRAGGRTRTVGALWALPPGSRTWVEVLGRMRGRTDRAAAQSLALGRAGERSVSDTIWAPVWLRVKSRRL